MKLILARHGNTFRADESAFYVGSQHDLPLVEFGITQAKLLGQCLSKMKPLTAVYTGPLLRMQATAQCALQEMHMDMKSIIDERLNELDYGLWSGLTSQEVKQRFGDDDYERWERQSLWPEKGAWGESEPEVIDRIRSFSEELIRRHADQDQVLVVASNGCLRYFLKLVHGAFDQQVAKKQLKIGTGHLCQLSYNNAQWHLDFWNQDPATLVL
ncbi:MAG: phosphoglycerate mutase [Legionella sp.]|nr:MAG: phosphoglycerate mutase [Legionella sp.]